MFIAETVGIPPATLFADQPAFDLWRDILTKGATAQLNRNIVAAVNEKNQRNPKSPFLQALLRNEYDIPSEYQPKDAGGRPIFIASDDVITVPEALLFHDDLTLGTGRIPWMVAVLGRLQTLAPAVCKIHSTVPGMHQVGTGFRISSDLLLTNWHVIGHASKVLAEFGYEDDGTGGGLSSNAYQCDVTSIRGSSEYDWAVIGVPAEITVHLPIIKLSDAAEPVMIDPAFIIQHPLGARKRISFVRNQITGFNDRVVHYLSDTQGGSSGSPVLNGEGRIVALHHAGGTPQQVAGKPPLSKNEGIRIPRVIEGIEAEGLQIA